MRLPHNHSHLRGVIHVPGDKSISHRAIMFGSIAQGKTTIRHFLRGQDCLSTIDCFRKLGVHIEEDGQQITILGKGWEGLEEPKDILYTGNSGTTTRLIMGILAGRPFHSVLMGDESIGRRPMDRVVLPLREMGASISGRENGKFTPISINGGSLRSIHYKMPVASAQVKSALLFAGLQAEGTTVIEEMAPTRDHTEKMIKEFGGECIREGMTISVKGSQSFEGRDIYVPGDISSAAFFLAAGAIIPGSEIILKNVGLNPTRSGIIDVLKEMGADLELSDLSSNGEETGTIVIRYSQLKGIEIGGSLIPRLIDEIPIIALMATQAEGETVIKDAEELKVKETNRIDTVVGELKKLGADIESRKDGMVIRGKTALKGGKVSSFGDHRIGMMLAIAALLSKDPVDLENPECIAVSYPNFFDDLQKLI
ncbi:MULTISPECIES: 3-phosphoshikimate 1-carboxyvinyltransferase [Bacillus]|uniref:3-phosphoshikimate 1-carboxyvinyltransferase n=1 Tax=Bacillus TaxID=1386 RepID=UPI002E239E4C|nr:3-phosphoshikimate 1-carboxyvinyltransferase [Bacillus smithii]MED1420126.1 3-phosphoshikimate 1-carboxyvinyltransferase [Bacillus smithii]MED1455626.1 3-phosphoshikimate 1-carboxyvinyltransferase [Bacillus smithii]